MASERDEEQLARELAEELRRLRVEDVVIQTLVTVSSIGYRRLGLGEGAEEERDLGQVQLAVETMQALTPLLARVVPGQLVKDFEASVASLQLAYARAVSAGQGAEGQ